MKNVNTDRKVEFVRVDSLPNLRDDFSESKDWKEGNYSDRIEWLMMMVKNYRQEISRLSEETPKIPCRLDLLIEQLAEVFEDSYSTQNNWIQPISNLLREWKKLKRN